jgi:hypothetical protein
MASVGDPVCLWRHRIKQSMLGHPKLRQPSQVLGIFRFRAFLKAFVRA